MPPWLLISPKKADIAPRKFISPRPCSLASETFRPCLYIQSPTPAPIHTHKTNRFSMFYWFRTIALRQFATLARRLDGLSDRFGTFAGGAGSGFKHALGMRLERLGQLVIGAPRECARIESTAAHFVLNNGRAPMSLWCRLENPCFRLRAPVLLTCDSPGLSDSVGASVYAAVAGA